MASLLIRNVDDTLRAQLKARAKAHHRSLEEEARETLRIAVARDASEPQPGEDIVAIFSRLFGPEHGVELDLPPRSTGRERPPLDFSGPEFGIADQEP